MSESRSVREWIDAIAAELKGVVDRPRREGELLLMHHLGRDQLWLMTHQGERVENPKRLINWMTRRKAHEPLEYLTHRVSFYSETFYIEPGALIPRPETELLIDKVLECVDKEKEQTIVEVGVGSGVISIILAMKLPKAKIIAVDISEKALDIAKKNIADFALEDRITLRYGHLLDPVTESIDVLVSNPPYVADDAPLEPNLSYEPDMALFGGPVGDEILQELLDAVEARRIPVSAFEFGYDQRARVTAYLEGRPYGALTFYKDLTGFDRGFVLHH